MKRASSSTSNTDESPVETGTNKIASLECRICGRTDFLSRNKLYKHLNICRVSLENNYVKDSSFNEKYDAYIYVSGGRLRGRTLGSVERYSLRRNCWEVSPPMLENRGSHGSAAIGEILYVIGGGGMDSNLDSNESFAASTGEWSSVASMPTSRHALVCVPFGTDIYAIGGWMDGTVCSAHLEKYNTRDNTWSKCASMSIGRRLLGACVFENSLYVFGGNVKNAIVEQQQERENINSAAPTISTDSSLSTSINVPGQVVGVVGDTSTVASAAVDWYTSAVEIYDIATNTWRRGKDLPASNATSAVAVGSFVYVFIHGHSLVRYDPSRDDYVTLCSELPMKEWYCFDVTTINGDIYLHGGATEGIWSNALFKYSPSTNSWASMASMNKHRRRCSAAVVLLPPDNKSALFCGEAAVASITGNNKDKKRIKNPDAQPNPCVAYKK